MNTATLETLRANLFAAAAARNAAPFGPAYDAASRAWSEAADALAAARPKVVAKKADTFTGRYADAMVALGGPVRKESGGVGSGAPVTWARK